MNSKSFLRIFTGISVMACLALWGAVHADTPKAVPSRGPATIKELMTLVVEPASNGVFQAASEAPKNEAEWKTLQGQALTLLEVANSLNSATRSKDKKQWPIDAKHLQDQSKIAFAAAMAKDAKALADISDSLYETCANCHQHYPPK